LLASPHSCAQVQEKAVALGLIHQPAPESRAVFSPKSLSRLLLAGFRLPAQLQIESLENLNHHLREGRTVMVFINGGNSQNFSMALSPLFQIQGFVPGDAPPSGILLSEPGLVPYSLHQRPMDRFLACWEKAGNLALVAARHWEDLPLEGQVFFGGLRDHEGVYHWTTAECDTDVIGRILRY
jgi:hypothetical protein